MTIVSIHQPNYIPWLGYFHKVLRSDVFVFYDNVQMPMGKSFVTRNQVKAEDGPRWLTIPTPKLGSPGTIRQTPILDGTWPRKHLGSLRNWYRGSPWLDQVCQLLEKEFDRSHASIGELNGAIITRCVEMLPGSDVEFVYASQMQHGVSGAGSIIPILEELGAEVYLTGSGKGSMRHFDEEAFENAGIRPEFVPTVFDAYPQRHGEFCPNLSILDAILNVGPEATLKIISSSQ